MCTSILMKGDGTFFGRNMDLNYSLEKNVIITPRKFPFQFRAACEIKEHFAIIGMGMVKNGYPLYFEAANEQGLAMAGLHFPGNAYYSSELDDALNNISPFELIPWVLSKSKSVDDAEKLLENTNVCDIDFSPEMPFHRFIGILRTKNVLLLLTKQKIVFTPLKR